MLAYDEQLVVTRQTLASAQEYYKIVKLQFDTGTAPELTLQQAQSVVEQANANLAAQIRFRAQAENALVLLLGQPLPADLPPAVRLNEQQILTDVPAGLPSDLLARRPDILQAEALLRSENANIGAARAAFFPRIGLTGSVGTASAALSGLYNAQLTLVTARMQRLTNLVDLYRALGGGWIQHTGDEPRAETISQLTERN